MPTSFASSNALEQAVERLNTWKGLVAVKTDEVLAPTKYSTLALPVDFSACKGAEERLIEAITTIRSTQNVAAGLPQDLKTGSLRILGNLLAKLNQGATPPSGLLQPLLERLPAESSPATVNLTCSDGAAEMIEQSVCSLFQQQAAAVKDGLVAATNAASIPAMLGTLVHTVQEYRRLLDKLERVWKHPESPEAWYSLRRVFNAPCPALFGGCDQVPEADEYSKLIDLARITSVEKSSGNPDGIVVRIRIPCSSADSFGRYQLYTLPYLESGKSRQLEIDESELWVKETVTSDPKEYQLAGPVCSRVAQGHKSSVLPPICLSSTGAVTPTSVSGTTNEIDVQGTARMEDPEVTVLDTDHNRYLLYLPNNTKVTYQCPAEEIDSTLEGLMSFAPAAGCLLKIGTKILLGNSPWEDEMHTLFPPFLTFKGGHLSSAASKVISQVYKHWGARMWEFITMQMKQYWPVYLTVTLSALLIVIVLGISCHYFNRHQMSGTVRTIEAGMETTYVIERNPRFPYP
jgi:hypothetical protein